VSEPLKGLALGLVSFLVVNLSASAVVIALARLWLDERSGRSAVSRTRALFTLRLFPAAASLLAVLVLFVPAHLAFEPSGSGEAVGAPILALAALSCLVIAAAVRRAVRAWNETRRISHGWAASARPVALAVTGLPAYELTHPFPVVSVLGVFRPRLYVASQVIAALNDTELAAVLEHELAHVAARDNLRYWLLRGCPDVVAWLPGGRALLPAWLCAAEEAADERAALGSGDTALALADALIKVARLVTPDRAALVPALALHNGDDLARRIRRLLLSPPPPPSATAPSRAVALSGGVLLLAALPFYAPTLRVVHGLSERLLAFLS
jgi:Zn-dependent protease with chaperone function